MAHPGLWWVPAAVSGAVAGLWVALSVWHPYTTYHGGALLVALAWPWAARRVAWEAPEASASRRRVTTLGPVAAGVALSLAVTGVLSWADVLAGPTVVHRGSAAVEAVVAALLAGLYGVAREEWRSSGPER